jgi:hypothetical protein
MSMLSRILAATISTLIATTAMAQSTGAPPVPTPSANALPQSSSAEQRVGRAQNDAERDTPAKPQSGKTKKVLTN